MSKKKKRLQTQTSKQSKARHFNNFKKDFYGICSKFEVSGLAEHLDGNDWKFLYFLRINKPRYDFATPLDRKRTPKALAEERFCFLMCLPLKNWIPEAPDITFGQYLYMGMMLYSAVDLLSDSENTLHERLYPYVKEKSDQILSLIENVEHHLNIVQYIISSGLSEYDTMYRWFERRTITKKNSAGESFTTVTFFIHTRKPKSKTVALDGMARKIYPLCYIFRGVTEELFLKTSTIYPEHNSDTKIPVYIQSHALIRLRERLDELPAWMIHLNLLGALKLWDAQKTSTDSWLVEYRIPEARLGYLSVVMHCNMLIVRTFLFLTNSGTPEGQKLSKAVGLYKQDKHYLNLDKLSTFLQPDLRSNEYLCNIFREAGCGDLLDVKRSGVLDVKPAAHADYIEQYINRREQHLEGVELMP